MGQHGPVELYCSYLRSAQGCRILHGSAGLQPSVEDCWGLLCSAVFCRHLLRSAWVSRDLLRSTGLCRGLQKPIEVC